MKEHMTTHSLLLLSLAAALAARAQTAAPSVTCPETIAVTESAAPVDGWGAASAQATHKFERISVFNGHPGGEEYDLAPDDEKTVGKKTVQTWILKDYRSMNLFLRCRYRDTEATLHKDLPAPLAACTLSFELQKDGAIGGKPTAVCR
jgi:hypothetical protein